jgi:hypothetical protein
MWRPAVPQITNGELLIKNKQLKWLTQWTQKQANRIIEKVLINEFKNYLILEKFNKGKVKKHWIDN